MSGGALRLYLGDRLASARVVSTELRQELPQLRVRPGESRLALVLPTVARGSHAWYVDWTADESTGGGSRS